MRERWALMSRALVGEKAATPASVVTKYFPRASGNYYLLEVRAMGREKAAYRSPLRPSSALAGRIRAAWRQSPRREGRNRVWHRRI